MPIGAEPTATASGPRALACFALVVVTLVVYAPVRGFDFVDLDDPRYVTANSVVQQGVSPAGLRWALSESHDANWFPLTWLSHMLDVELFGLAPGGHHATSVLLHVANALLLLWALTALSGAFWPSALVAGLFALHPLHVESVAWVAERKDVLSSFFGLAALVCHARFARAAGGEARCWQIGTAVCLALGLLAKPMLVTLPFVLVLLDRWPLGRLASLRPGPELAGRLREKLPLFALSVLSCTITLLAQRGGGAMAPGESVGLGHRLANALVAYATYLRRTFWPSDLAVYYPHPYLPSEGGVALSAGVLLGSAALLLTASALAWRFRERGYPAVGWLWFLGMLVPVIGLVQVGGQAHADRYTYLPLVGIFIVLAWGLRDLVAGAPGRARLAALAVLLVLAVLAGVSRRQVASWRDTETLYEHALALRPDNHFVRYALALALRHRGRAGEALEHYQRILALRPGAARAWNGLGRSRLDLGEPEAALEAFDRAAAIVPDTALVQFNRATALRALGRDDEALAGLRRAAELRPDGVRARVALGEMLAERGEAQEAAAQFRAALALEPGHAGALRGLAGLAPPP